MPEVFYPLGATGQRISDAIVQTAKRRRHRAPPPALCRMSLEHDKSKIGVVGRRRNCPVLVSAPVFVRNVERQRLLVTVDVDEAVGAASPRTKWIADELLVEREPGLVPAVGVE